jgi:hypothetical protein
MICCTEPGLSRPCMYCIYINRVTCKMGRKKNWRWTVTADSDWQETDVTYRQRGRPTVTRQQNSDRFNVWSQVPQWARHQDVLTDWPLVVTWLQLQKNRTAVSSQLVWCSDVWGGLTGHEWCIYSESDKSSGEYSSTFECAKNWTVKHNFCYWMSNEPCITTDFYKLQWTPKLPTIKESQTQVYVYL